MEPYLLGAAFVQIIVVIGTAIFTIRDTKQHQARMHAAFDRIEKQIEDNTNEIKNMTAQLVAMMDNLRSTMEAVNNGLEEMNAQLRDMNEVLDAQFTHLPLITKNAEAGGCVGEEKSGSGK